MSKTKQQAFDQFEQERAELLLNARWVAQNIAERHSGKCNIDQVRSEVKCPTWVNPKFFGAVFADGNWERIGYVTSTRPETHGRPISQWYLKRMKGKQSPLI